MSIISHFKLLPDQMDSLHQALQHNIRTIQDFPKPGILYYDITTVLLNPVLFRRVVFALAERYSQQKLDRVIAIESRGFLFGAPLAQLLSVPLVPVRKAGKLPAAVEHVSYVLEYGEDHLEVHSDALPQESRVVIVDDLIATGGTLEASVRLAERLGCKVIECAALVELVGLGARERLASTPIFTLTQYDC
jgi:adenine phosphoribosyltransferase